MIKKLLLIIAGVLCVVITACSTTSTPNVNVNAVTNVNMPPEFSASPVPMSSLPPGIPDPNSNVSNLPKGTTPIPGIPDQKELAKPFKKGPTPIPGIPDEVIRNNPLSSSSNMSKNDKKPPQSKSDTSANSANKPPDTRKF